MYVDDWITGQDTREEALFMSRHAKNIMKEAGMEMRKWISNDTILMVQWAAEGFDTHPMDASIRLGTNKTKVLGMAWQTLDDCLTLDTKDNLRIPRLVLDSTNDEVSDLIEIHIFCDASKLAYGAAAYVKVRKQNEVLVNLITSKTRVAPLKAVTLPRLELLGALVAALLSSRVQEIVRKKKECKVFHWTDSKIVLFWIKGSSKRWKQFVANRVQEISKLSDPDSWFHCSGQDNDILISNKWWTGPAFLRTDELPKTVSECPELNEVDYLPELKSKDSKEHTVLTLNFNQTFFDHLLSRSNRFLTIVRVLSFLYRFLFNIRNPTNKKRGPLTSDEMEEAEIYLMKQVQRSSFYKEIRAMQNGDDICNKSKILNLSPFLDDKGIIRVGGRLKHSRLPYSSKHPILLLAKSGEPKSVKRLRSGDLLVETNSALQTKSFLLAKHFLNSPVTISPHKTLNSCRGIISETDLLGTPDGEILEGFSSQGVIQCQRFGHSQTSCRGQLTCSRCASVGHASTDCNLEPKCVNCLQPHPSDSKICPKWKIEKKIQEIKTTKNISYPEARKLIVPQLSQTYAQAAKSSTLNNSTQTDENITKIKCPPLKLLPPLSSKQRTHIPTAVTTSSSAQTQLLPSISSKTSTTSDPQPPTPISKTKGKIKEQPSPLHRSRKDNIKIDLMRIKPPSNLKKNPEKNTSVKIAREQDSPNETSPVSKKSRRRKTFKIADAMETDANPSDTDYVTGLASEEDESFLEADFTQVADNPLKGPLSPSSLKK
ncbi:integrase catalytic domain-containing protein [Trichonephila clavipes]|nr:integrase catalytic domain-containing protein [Trichonephila clavipes]